MTSFAKTRADLILIGVLCFAMLAAGSGNIQQDGFTDSTTSEPSTEICQSSGGNLRSLHFEVKDGRYALNGIQLPKITANSVLLSTANHAYKVRVTLLKTVLVSHGKPIDQGDRELLEHWSKDIPKVSAILKQQDTLGSLKVVSYDLIGLQKRQNLQLQEQLMLLWSANPIESKRVGQMGFGTPMRFTEPLVDVQYRASNFGSDHLFKKTFLQIFYIQRGDRRMTLGSFVITSNPSGAYEFYLIPRGVLDRIVIATK